MPTDVAIARSLNEISGYSGLSGKLLAHNFDAGCLREFIDADRHVYYALNGHTDNQQVFIRKTSAPVAIPGVDYMPHQLALMGMGAQPAGAGPIVLNTPANLLSGTAGALLTRDEWFSVDQKVLQVALPRLRLWQRLRAAVPRTIPNGLSQIMLLWQAESDAGNATFSMSPARQAGRDRPTFDQRALPLPIVHGDFSFDIRELAVSRRNGNGLDVSMAGKTARKIAEAVEKLTLGTLSSYAYGGGTVYGLRNFPDRVTASFTLPTDPSWTPETLVNELLAAIQTLSLIFFYGPFVAFYSPNWQRFFNADYAAAYKTGSVKSRLAEISEIVDWQQLDYMTGYEIILVQLDSDVIEAISGMDLTTVQWEEQGGMEVCFKIMAIMVPHVKSDANGNTGIIHCTAA